MGNPQSTHKQKSSNGRDTVDSDTGVIINTPYLNRMFQKLAESTKQEQPSLKEDLISRNVFEATFNGPLNTLGTLLYNLACAYDASRKTITKKEFVTAANQVLSVLNEDQQVPFYFQLFAQGKDHLTTKDVEVMVHICYSVALASAFVPYSKCDRDEEVLAAISDSITQKKSQVDLECFSSWCFQNCEGIFSGVHSWLTCKLAVTNMFRPEDEHYVPALEHLLKSSSNITLAMLWVLSCTLPACYRTTSMTSRGSSSDLGAYSSPSMPSHIASKLLLLTRHYSWHMLYNSNEQGLSVNRFEHHVFQYKGPTVSLIYFGDDHLFCAAVDTEWREDSVKWGGDNCTIIQLLPNYAVVESGPKMFFMNHAKRGLPKGIQLGKTPNNPVLLIDDDLTNVTTSGGISSKLKGLEVWGTAGIDIKDAQVRQKQWETKEAEKHQQRKLKFDGWDQNPDRMLLEWAGMTTSHAQK